MPQAVKVYSKAVPLTTYAQLERSFRDNDFGIYLIAFVRPFGRPFMPMTAGDLTGCSPSRRERSLTPTQSLISRVSLIACIALGITRARAQDVRMLVRGGLLHRRRTWNGSRMLGFPWIAVFQNAIIVLVRALLLVSSSTNDR